MLLKKWILIGLLITLLVGMGRPVSAQEGLPTIGEGRMQIDREGVGKISIGVPDGWVPYSAADSYYVVMNNLAGLTPGEMPAHVLSEVQMAVRHVSELGVPVETETGNLAQAYLESYGSSQTTNGNGVYTRPIEIRYREQRMAIALFIERADATHFNRPGEARIPILSLVFAVQLDEEHLGIVLCEGVAGEWPQLLSLWNMLIETIHVNDAPLMMTELPQKMLELGSPDALAGIYLQQSGGIADSGVSATAAGQRSGLISLQQGSNLVLLIVPANWIEREQPQINTEVTEGDGIQGLSQLSSGASVELQQDNATINAEIVEWTDLPVEEILANRMADNATSAEENGEPVYQLAGDVVTFEWSVLPSAIGVLSMDGSSINGYLVVTELPESSGLLILQLKVAGTISWPLQQVWMSMLNSIHLNGTALNYSDILEAFTAMQGFQSSDVEAIPQPDVPGAEETSEATEEVEETPEAEVTEEAPESGQDD